VVDAAGAIYVIGGGTYQDVWASTDGGADWTRRCWGWYRGTLRY
jgi:hypothetical protein